MTVSRFHFSCEGPELLRSGPHFYLQLALLHSFKQQKHQQPIDHDYSHKFDTRVTLPSRMLRYKQATCVLNTRSLIWGVMSQIATPLLFMQSFPGISLPPLLQNRNNETQQCNLLSA